MTNHPSSQSPVNEPMHPPLPENQSAADLSSQDQVNRPSLLQSRGAVLSFVFLVAGVVGLPLLWMNPNFSRAERVLWTVLVVLYSITILILAGGILWWIYQLIFGV